MAMSLSLLEKLSLSSGGGLSYDYYVDGANGSDSNDGTSLAQAFETIAQFLAVSGIGSSAGLVAGQYHVADTTKSSDRTYGKQGVGSNPVIDARQLLSGKTWTLSTGNTWVTTISLSTNSIPGGVGSNTTNFGVWDENENFAEWMVGGVDIAANVAAVDASGAFAFAINLTGSTVEDIRDDVASTGPFDLYVRLADGSDPNGVALRCSDQQAAGSYNGGLIKDIVFQGSFGKDHVGVASDSYGGDVITLRNVRIPDHGEHGWVGPLNGEGILTTIGAARKGTTYYDKNRALGGGLNIYTNAYVSDRDLYFNQIVSSDVQYAFYGHGSGNQGYRSVIIGKHTVDNAIAAVNIQPVPTTLLPLINDGLTISDVDYTDIEFGFRVDGDWAINSGTIVFDATPTDVVGSILVTFVGAAPSMTLTGVTFEFLAANTAGRKNFIASRGTSIAFTTPILTLDNCHDISAAGKKGFIQRGGTDNILSKIDLRLTNGTTIGSIMDQAAGTNYPAAITVDAGCTFGMGDRTGPDIISDLTAASVPHTISNDTTIVNLAGAVVSSPGW